MCSLLCSNPRVLTAECGDIGERRVGDQLNLERAMGAHVRFGGHFVQVSLDVTPVISCTMQKRIHF